MITVSVPGKVHLMGEHAVVYGKPALLAAINKRLCVSVEPNADEQNTFTAESSDSSDFIIHAANFVVNELQIPQPTPVHIRVDSEIPAGYHLGSSAAVAVGVVGALLYFYKKIWNPVRINELAYEIEKKQHGNPSGGDNTTVTMGGFIWYRKELEFLKSMWQLPFAPHESLNHFFLINTSRPIESTGEMVAAVAKRMKQKPRFMQRLMDLNEVQVKRVTTALKFGREDELIDAIRVGEKTLEGMGVVSSVVVPCLRDIELSGGAVKILGGGGHKQGVGFLLCYHTHPEELEHIIKRYGYSVEAISLGEEGVRLDEK